MKISQVDKITPGHGLSIMHPHRFWELIAPRLLEHPSLEIIQTLIREDRPLSARNLASHLDLGVEMVRNDLMAMEREGTLVRASFPGLSSKEVEDETLYRLGEPTPASSPDPASAACADGVPRLSRAGRDALYEELVVDLAQASDLERLAESEDPKHIEECEVIGARLLNALRLIQEGGLGWGRSGDADFVELSLPPQELARLVAHRHQILTGFVESQPANWERDKREFQGFVSARDACGLVLDQLRPALAEL